MRKSTFVRENFSEIDCQVIYCNTVDTILEDETLLRGEEEKIKATICKAFSSFEDLILGQPNMKKKPKHMKKPYFLITRNLDIPDKT